MKFLPTQLNSVAENLALDEALLELADQGEVEHEVLRLWEADSTFVVVGRSSKVDAEVQRSRAEASGIPIFRRVSGGTSIVAAPGCMFYSVLLDLERRPHLRMLDEAHRFVMSKLVAAIQPIRQDTRLQGTCDLVVDGPLHEGEVGHERKVSGNSVRIGRHWMLYHGTLLVDMDLDLIAKLLKHPPREPEYRGGRDHANFLANLHVDPLRLRSSLQGFWQADELFTPLPTQTITRLVQQRYLDPAWNFQR